MDDLRIHCLRHLSFFVTATIIKLFWTGTLWDILWVLCCIQLIGLVKAAYACILRQNAVMLFMSLYSALYMTSLLPAKYFAIITMNKSSWGTSGRRKMVGNYIPLAPLSVWAAILLGGLGYTIYRESIKSWTTDGKKEEIKFMIFGAVAYVCYWLVMICLYWMWFRRLFRNGHRVTLWMYRTIIWAHYLFRKTCNYYYFFLMVYMQFYYRLFLNLQFYLWFVFGIAHILCTLWCLYVSEIRNDVEATSLY